MASPRPRVLVVDDDEDVARLTAAMLLARGCDVSYCFSGRAALSAVRARAPQVLFLNWQMPDLDGLSVLDILKARPATARIKVVMTSAHSASSFAPRCRAAGADALLSIPFRGVELAAVLAHVLGPAPAEFAVAGGWVSLAGGRR